MPGHNNGGTNNPAYFYLLIKKSTFGYTINASDLLDEVDEALPWKRSTSKLLDEIVFYVFFPNTCSTLDQLSREWMGIAFGCPKGYTTSTTC